MAGKKRPSSSMEEPTEEQTEKAMASIPSSSKVSEKLKQMERRKVRKALDKERRRVASEGNQKSESKSESNTEEEQNPESELKQETKEPVTSVAGTSLTQPGLHLDLFRGLSSQESSVREEAAERLVRELRDVQRSYEESNGENGEQGDPVKLEAEKDDGMENCAPSLRYAIRRFIRGVSSSREFARQGFALALAAVVAEIHAIKLDSLMKFIVEELEVSSGMKGQEAKDNLLGRLFAYASIARSSRISEQWMSDKNSSIVKDFVAEVTSLAAKKRYLSEPAVSVILDLVNKLPEEAVLTQVLEAPDLKDWFERAAKFGDPDALFLALKLQERVKAENDVLGNLLPCPFSADKFFARDHLLFLSPCFKESTFCLPRLHGLWPVVVNMLLPDMPALEETNPTNRSTKKHKKSKKGNSSEDSSVNLCNFCEVVIESSLLFSSHDRKCLALNILLLTLPKLSASNLQVILSSKVVYCLMDILSNKSSWLYKAGQHFLTEVMNFVGENLDRRIAAIVSLQKHSRGRFDNITKTQTVKQLIAKFDNADGCMHFVDSLISLFVDEGPISDEPSDQSQTTDENSEVGSAEDKDPLTNGNGTGSDTLKNWVIDTMPRVIKNLKLNSNLKTLTDEEIVRFSEDKFKVQAAIMKFLTVQGLFTASLGTEVTSFELQEKFTWPKAAISNALRESCIRQLQVLLEEAQKSEGARILNEIEPNDLASYFTRFVETVSSIPSVSLFTALGDEDDKAFKKLLKMESKLSNEERKVSPGTDSSRMHAMRFLLMQLLLQILLHPGEFHEAAIDLTICCKKAFSFLSQGNSEEEEEEEEGSAPQFMDVLVDTFLSLLPHSSGPLNYAIEQVFRCFCDEVTDAGLIRMLRIVKKELNPRHLAPAEEDSGDEDEDDFLEIEEDDEVAGDGGAGLSDESEGIAEPGSVVDADDEDREDGMDVDSATNEDDENEDSDGMDDDAMFRMDAYLAAMFNEKRTSGNDSAAQSQFLSFKFRVLSLLEIYLQKNSGKAQALTVYSFLVQAYVKSHANTGGEQFRQRITGILQRKIFKAKEYPKFPENQVETLKTLIEKSLKLVSRSRFKDVSSLAQNATFWLLKITTSMNCANPELESVVEVFRNTLVDYFNNKKSRLKLGFVKEVVRRYPWVGTPLYGLLIEKCCSTKAEFRQIETLDLLDFIMKSYEKDSSCSSKLVKKHLKIICELIGKLLTNMPQKQSRRADVRRFCTRVLNVVSGLKLNKKFIERLTPEVCTLCEAQLGAAFKPFKTEE
ncbi:DNA polymerase V [Rhynchospora pubera]|uniref:DNA polymerase V n=1 Tax=Rhynchospora pubera TaxID=906938 RepID=A0AAV8CQU3_9POAL|nr:DNA polymerase V [Rhynchospora pubera]